MNLLSGCAAVDDNCLCLEEVFEAVASELTADTRLLVPTERRIVEDAPVGVVADLSALKFSSHFVSLALILCEHSTHEAVFRVISKAESFIDAIFTALELEDGHNRSKDLFLDNLHVTMAVSKDCRLNEVTWLVNAIATCDESGSLAFARLNVVEDLVELILGDDGSL